MLIFAAGFPVVYGKQILYFLDKTFSERARINAPEKSDTLGS
jgi:TRAG family protein